MTHYRQQDKQRFFSLLQRYRACRDAGGEWTAERSREFVALSIQIHGALADVPKSYKAFVNR